MLFIFDMGGVVTTTASVEKRACEILGISRKEFDAFCGSGATDLRSMLSDGIIGSQEFWRMFSMRSGIGVKTDWWQMLFHPELKPETVGLVRELKGMGHRVVCGTNTIESFYRIHLERGDYSYFDQTYSSCFMGVSKPDPEFWKIILMAEDSAPQNTVFIDDKEENCKAAAKLRIRAIQFTDFDSVKAKVEQEISRRRRVVGEYNETAVRT